MRGFIDGEYQDGELRGLVFIVGDRGMGKTTLMNALLSQCTGGRIFFDTLSKHAGVFQGWVIVAEPGQLAEYLRDNRGRRFAVLYQPRAGNLDEHFRAVCRIVRAFGWMIFGADEIDLFCGSQWGPKRMPPELSHLVNYGRHERVSMIATARRPQDVARSFVGQSQLRAFHVDDQAIIDYLSDRMGQKNAERLRSLGKYFYLHCPEGSEPILRGGPGRPR